MQTHGYQRSAPWKQALALLDQTRALTAGVEDDPMGMAGRLNALAAELPVLAATAFEQLDYDNARAHARAACEHLFRLELNAQVALHLGLITPRQLNELIKRLNTLDQTLVDLPDELFEDDGVDTAQAA